MPLAITHPRDISQTIKIRLPEEWNLADSETEIESEAFVYRRSRFYANRIITLRYHYRTKASFVSVDAAGDHLEKMDDALDDTGLTIYKPLAAGTPRATNGYVILFLVIAAGAYVIRKRFRS